MSYFKHPFSRVKDDDVQQIYNKNIILLPKLRIKSKLEMKQKNNNKKALTVLMQLARNLGNHMLCI